MDDLLNLTWSRTKSHGFCLMQTGSAWAWREYIMAQIFKKALWYETADELLQEIWCWFGDMDKRVHYTPPPILVGFQSVQPEFLESSGIWSTFFYIYFTLHGTIPARIIIEFSPGFHGIPWNPPRLIFIWNNRNNRSHGTSRTNQTQGALPNKRNTPQRFELLTSAPQAY